MEWELQRLRLSDATESWWLQLVATGSTPEALERLQAALAAAGWERRRFVVPAPAPSRLLLEDRSSLLPAVAAVRRPVICTATTVVVQVRAFSRHLAFLPARSSHLVHRWSRTEAATGNPLVMASPASVSMSCHCCESPFRNSICVMPRYRFLLPVPSYGDALQAGVN